MKFNLTCSFLSVTLFNLILILSPFSLRSEEQANESLNRIPSELLEKPFRASSRIVLDLDGSTEAGGIERRSETFNKVLFLNAENWRARREIPFQRTSLEVLQTSLGSFIMTQTNRKISSEETYNMEFWVEIVLFAEELSKRWGFFEKTDDFGEWLELVQKLEEPLINPEGDQVRSQVTKDNSTQRTQVILEGSSFHDDRTKLKIRAEWVLETGMDVQQKDLDTALVVGEKN